MHTRTRSSSAIWETSILLALSLSFKSLERCGYIFL
uniref:Uncharacterized protein n=1 Tax=Anguilla anguilla TaxID=7936 RepID=A0A0E9WH71_ANGAN